MQSTTVRSIHFISFWYSSKEKKKKKKTGSYMSKGVSSNGERQALRLPLIYVYLQRTSSIFISEKKIKNANVDVTMVSRLGN